jgi:hypothetical protein
MAEKTITFVTDGEKSISVKETTGCTIKKQDYCESCNGDGAMYYICECDGWKITSAASEQIQIQKE